MALYLVSVSDRIRRARPDEACQISELAQGSKAVWGYSAEQMAVFADELTLREDDVEASHAHVLEAADSTLLGFYTLSRQPGIRMELEHLFVAPEALRAGHGRRLLIHAAELAGRLGAETLEIQSDPHASEFYQGFGAEVVSQVPTSIPGRTLPLLVLPLPIVCQRAARD
jgi:GNAT superfamily N-acetyltransferase